jgi:hypothetical protein
MKKISNLILGVFLVLGILFFTTTWACGASVSLAWNANSEPDLAGYRIFYRPVGGTYNYQNPIWEGTQITCTVQVDEDGFFVARAFDTSGNESGNSNEVFEGRITPPASPGSLIISAIDLAIQALEKLKEAISLNDQEVPVGTP